jgi:hypothetical protein
VVAADWDEGSREIPGSEPPSPAGPPGPVFDLWSPPPGALNLDESLMSDTAALDRLAAVLPVLGPDLDPDLAPGPDLDPGPDLTGPALPASRGTPGPEGLLPAPSRPGPRSRREIRADAGRVRSRGLSPVSVLLLLVVVYTLSVAALLGWDAWSGQGSDPGGREGGGIVIDGPPPCPMYRSPESAKAQASGACFFVG